MPPSAQAAYRETRSWHPEGALEEGRSEGFERGVLCRNSAREVLELREELGLRSEWVGLKPHRPHTLAACVHGQVTPALCALVSISENEDNCIQVDAGMR